MIHFEKLIDDCDDIKCSVKKTLAFNRIWELYKLINIDEDLSHFGFEIDSGKDEQIRKEYEFIKLLIG